jgi:glucose-1-phosphate thymidylyltransferase
MGFIDDDQLARRAKALLKSGYGDYLLQLLERR